MTHWEAFCRVSDPKELLEGRILLVDKPLNWTSFDVVGKLKWLLRAEAKLPKFKIGHAGTLDPLATGLLIVCTGKMTKEIQAIQDGTKEYTGVIRLGATTPSYDRETLPENVTATNHLTESDLLGAAAKLTGPIEQIPPVYSAKQIDGVRAYELARKQEEVTMKVHHVVVEAFELTSMSHEKVSFRIRCSKGTYIRSLAHEFGQILGVGGYLESLRRTASFPFLVEDSKSPLAWAKEFCPTYEAVNEQFSDESVKKVFTKAF